jgi:hypothetical protein
MIQFTVTGGTGDVIAATMSPQIPTTQAGKLYLFTPTANNTGAVTINGVPVKSAVGSTLVSGSLLSGVPVSMIWQVDHYQLLTSLPVDASGILADAIAARDDAEDSADAATATATAVAGTIG